MVASESEVFISRVIGLPIVDAAGDHALNPPALVPHIGHAAERARGGLGRGIGGIQEHIGAHRHRK